MKIKKTIKIDEKLNSDLLVYAEERGLSQSELIEGAIRSAIREPYGSHTQDSQKIADNSDLSSVLETLQAEIKIKNEQIAALNAALVSAQDTAKAAQALHAADVAPSLALESQEQKQSRWERLKAAWRG